MRNKARWLAIVGAVIAVLTAGAVIAYADTVSADGDTVKPNNRLSYTEAANFTERCSSRGTPASGAATIRFNGGRSDGGASGTHFDDGVTVTVTAVPNAAAAAAGITASGSTATVPTPWNTIDQTFTAALTTTVPASVPNGAYTINVEASGPAHKGDGTALDFHTSDTYEVDVNCLAIANAAPAISWTSHPASAAEGDTQAYSFSIADGDSTAWTFSPGSPSCGAGGALTGTPTIDATAKTGTFSCAFPNGPATTAASAKVSDGTDSSNELNQPVDVLNVAPSTQFTDAPATASESDTKTYAFTVSDPGTADTYSAASGSPSCASGSYVAGSLIVSGNHGSQSGTFRCAFPSAAPSTPVSIAFTDSDGATGGAATVGVTVLDAPLSAGALTIGDSVEGLTASQLSFSFTDANAAATAGDYTATIDWGDGTPAATGTVTAKAGGGFEAKAAHTYAEQGSYVVSVSVRDDGGSTAGVTGHAVVADAALTAGALTVGDGVEGGLTASQLSFSFTDANPGAAPTDFTATVTWGDGNSSVASVTAKTGGGFEAKATHAYADQGSYTVVVAVNDDGGSTAGATTQASVADAPLTGGATTVANGVEGVTASHLSFSFADANPGATPNHTASIAWGDGTTSAGTVAAVPGVGFTVSGDHQYADEGSYPVAVNVTGNGGSTAAGTGTALVADAPLTAGTLAVAPGVEGATPSALSFTFTDANPAATVADFTATINWGDGTTASGTVATVAGGFRVTKGHQYAEEGSYTVSISVADDGGSSAATSGPAAVADAPITASAPAAPVSVTSFSGRTATFTDANAAATIADFAATIDWGDGATSVGVVSAVSGGGFAVSGSHTYSRSGYTTVKTTILDDGGSTASASTQLLTYSFLRRGAYVIGDRSATGTVTFWSSQWSKKNVLSGSPSPSSFKGFAPLPRTPMCHVRWFALGGVGGRGDHDNNENDDDEPANGALPAYMAVIVTSTIAKLGPIITGDTAHLVIVKTDTQDNRGHDRDHSHIGTGTVVASVPGC